MRRILALLLAMMLLITLSACKSKSADAPAAEPEAAAAPETASAQEDEGPKFPPEMVGSWILVDSNDTALTEQTFPGVKEKGGSMEIGEDGALSWTIGSASGSGYIVESLGDEISAKFRSGDSGDLVDVPGLLENSNEALAYYLSYSGVDLIWVRIPPKTQ